MKAYMSLVFLELSNLRGKRKFNTHLFCFVFVFLSEVYIWIKYLYYREKM